MVHWFLARDGDNVVKLFQPTTGIPDNIKVCQNILNDEWEVLKIFNEETSAFLSSLFNFDQIASYGRIFDYLNEIIDGVAEVARIPLSPEESTS
ncbi:MAG: hypothetical protein G01um101433_388 [Parcubacteria group bacterium Gr01-1014_33]|nr:MAG: hypothetical protein G01um101433_388 [Parcubacteria group bacterium Gr01-1014_33]